MTLFSGSENMINGQGVRFAAHGLQRSRPSKQVFCGSKVGNVDP